MTVRRMALVLGAVALVIVVWFVGRFVSYAGRFSRYQAEYEHARGQIEQHLLKCPPGLNANGWQNVIGTTSNTISQTSAFTESLSRPNPSPNYSSCEQLQALNLDLEKYLAGKELLSEADIRWLYDRVAKTSPPAQAWGDNYRGIFESELRAVFHPTDAELLARDVMAESALEVGGIESKLEALSERPPPGSRVPAWKALNRPC